MTGETPKAGVGGLVAALRHGRQGGPAVQRSADLEAIVPQGHNARLVWEVVVGQDLARLHAALGKQPDDSSVVTVLFALWLHATCENIGSAAQVASLCQSDAGFRWLCGGRAVDARLLAGFRQPQPGAIDEIIAESLAGLLSAGIIGSSALSGLAQGAADRLRISIEESQRRVRDLRQHLAEPATSRPAGGEDRSGKAAAVLRELARISEVRKAEQFKREAEAQEAQRREAEARAAQRREAEARAAQRREAEAREAQRREQMKAAQAQQAPTRPILPAGALGPVSITRERSRSGYTVTVRPVFGFEPDLPWAIRADDGRFRKIGTVATTIFVLVASVLIFYRPPPPDRAEKEKISPRLAKLVLERKEQPKPEPVKIEKKPEEKKPDEKKPDEPTPEEPKPEAKKDLPQPKKPLEKDVAEARERAAKTGLVAMRDQLAALRDLSNTESLRQNQVKAGAATERSVERDLIGKAATGGSGGVATRQIAHSGGGTLAGRTTEKVAAPAGGAPSIAEVEREARGTKRTAEEIKLAFDANKSAIYGIYRRALRANPLLEGRVVLKLTIAPSGDVTACSIISSALKDPELEEKLVARVQLINFGSRPKLEVWTGNYHIDFVPSG